MFGFLKPDPLKKLQKAYDQKLEAAMHCQRNGDIRQYSLLSEEAEDIYRRIQTLEAEQQKS